MNDKLKEAIEVLKKSREMDKLLKVKQHPHASPEWHNERSKEEEAIDTVVEHMEQKRKSAEELVLDYFTEVRDINQTERLSVVPLTLVNILYETIPEPKLPDGYKCPCCGSEDVYLTTAAHCMRCAVTTEI